MTKPDFVYTTYIKSTPEKVWQALTNPEFTRQYWGYGNISDWQTGSDWHHGPDDGQEKHVVGKVLESLPPNRLVLTWASPENPEDDTQVTYEIEAIEDMVRLNVIHGAFKADSIMAEKVAVGWPRVLSSLKSFLETGAPLDTWAGHHSSCGSASAEKVAAH